MKFVDKVKITVIAGKGGAGAVSFRREKFIPKGGPDGGDGGKGGNVIFLPNSQKQTLMDLKIKTIYKAGNGEPGRGKNQTGKDGSDLIIHVPKGVMIFEDDTLIADLTEEEPFILAKGGLGGKGNARFSTSTNRTPRYAQPGLPGEEKSITLELRLIAQIGLVGLPNAGKSTLLKSLTNANPKIANYPFTTLFPNLGVLRLFDKELIIADIPGLIEGASQGLGLGHDFLRHVARTEILIHLVEAVPNEPEKAYQNYLVINEELKKSEVDLNNKKQIVVLNKIDVLPEEELNKTLKIFKTKKIKIIPISAYLKTNFNLLEIGILEDRRKKSSRGLRGGLETRN